MIYTVTFNPAIDYVVRAEKIVLGAVNRAESEQIFYGGKGINVSAVLAELDVKSTALGFTAGFTGEAIEKGVSAMGITSDFVRLPNGNSRINLKIMSSDETEINAQGPDIDKPSLQKLCCKLKSIQNSDTLILAGSIPQSLPSDIYEQILAMLSSRPIRTVVDASNDLLINVLKYHPFLIKPNNFELSDIFHRQLDSEEKICECAKKLQEMGARNVLVSMAADGAILLDENGNVHKCKACKGTLINSVGAGDSMLAGFIAGYDKGGYDLGLKLGTACGGATAFSDGLAKRPLIDELFAKMQ